MPVNRAEAAKKPNKHIQRLLKVPLYPSSQAEADLLAVQEMHPLVTRSKITKRALEIGLGRLASSEDDLVPSNDNGARENRGG